MRLQDRSTAPRGTMWHAAAAMAFTQRARLLMCLYTGWVRAML